MKKIDGWQIPLGVVVSILGISACIRFCLSASDIAAWFQAIGSVGAIGIAAYVMKRQFEQNRQDDENETRAFVQAIREELTLVWEGYEKDMRKKVLAVNKEGYLDSLYPVETDIFTIYNRSASLVGKVQDKDLRSAIIKTYGSAKGLVYSFKLNNRFIDEIGGQDIRGITRFDQIFQGKIRRACAYAQQIKELDQNFKKNMDTFFECADRYLREHP